MGLGFAFSQNESRAETGDTDEQSRELSTNLFPIRNLTLSAAAGNRRFTFAGDRRSVDYRTVGVSFSDKLIKTETIHVGLNASRSYNTDPGQGEDITDSYGANVLMEVRSGVTANALLGVSRSENRQFVSARQYDASGSLVERAQYDDRPTGFTFFDSEHSDLYTKNSPLLGDWSLPAHIESFTRQYGVSKSLQVNMVLTDRANISASYSTSFSSDSLDLTGTGSQSLSGILAYAPKRNLSVSVYRTLTLPESGNRSDATAVGLAYYLIRGHRVSMSYSKQESGGNVVESFSGNVSLALALARRTTMSISYAVSQPGTPEETYILKIGVNRSF